eukprot:CAMPEP_0174378866 /NCGR_PEP_ID=MMETSP0811_2-20130205/122325_1 /TAXON_ID=73025 ORGANISM="Eutreptiella gymnastica-like, Strain CCMP1594" /NCGR_SAMPLE_ID=MMETSP0811_2 /ASSEMBLY_ACC=CAM_ASM_000667 /LENGTH=131 /DNA_ID=CAMNT_0015531205 /DNA_START=163 /DNA_END=562 /DNA_ORIENTATION=-
MGQTLRVTPINSHVTQPTWRNAHLSCPDYQPQKAEALASLHAATPLGGTAKSGQGSQMLPICGLNVTVHVETKVPPRHWSLLPPQTDQWAGQHIGAIHETKHPQDSHHRNTKSCPSSLASDGNVAMLCGTA